MIIPFTAQHFRVAGEPKHYNWSRVLCGARGVKAGTTWRLTLELREAALVRCPHCMVVKDWWLEHGKPRLTIRRCRLLLRPLFGRCP